MGSEVTERARRFLVLTDMHFGTIDTNINRNECRAALVDYIVDEGPWDEIVLAGDILDANLSSLRNAIEGGDPGDTAVIVGFRQFLQEIHRKGTGGRQPALGLQYVAARWVYVPGNHDYRIWDMLSTTASFENVLARGRVLLKPKMPLRRGVWRGKRAFLAGIFVKHGEYDASDNLRVSYPDHQIRFGDELMLITHGHYLDRKQTRFTQLSEVLPPKASKASDKTVRRIVIETAQYQALSSAVSFTKGAKRIASGLFGESGVASKFWKIFDAARGWLTGFFFGSMRPNRTNLSATWLRNVDSYIEHFFLARRERPPVKWFVFGHTHQQAAGMTPRNAEVYNSGSCYQDGAKAITFVRVDESVPTSDSSTTPRAKVTLKCVTAVNGTWSVTDA